MRFIILIYMVVWMVPVWSQTVPKTMLHCYTAKDTWKKICLEETEDGKTQNIANGDCTEEPYFGFSFVPSHPGIYVIRGEKNRTWPVYVRGNGEEIHIYADPDTAYLIGKNTRENKLLYEWLAMSGEARTIAISSKKMSVDYTAFFPLLDDLVRKAEEFKNKLKSHREEFDAWLKRYINYDLDYIALSFTHTPRLKFPKKTDYPTFYETIYAVDKLQDDYLMGLPFGMDLLNKYVLEKIMTNGEPYMFEYMEKYVPDHRLKGELLLEGSRYFRSYADCMEKRGKWGEYLTPGQLKRLDVIAADMYQAEAGEEAANFNYPDREDKMVALSDFKGKVVLVDVWATWCGPCRKELPYLKKLEEEMKGTDLVVIGVSLDEKKNHAKWLKFIEDEQLPGVQLFADGWNTQIAKAYKIKGIPRFMVFGRNGKLVTAKSPRPSDPALKALLEEELKK